MREFGVKTKLLGAAIVSTGKAYLKLRRKDCFHKIKLQNKKGLSLSQKASFTK